MLKTLFGLLLVMCTSVICAAQDMDSPVDTFSTGDPVANTQKSDIESEKLTVEREKLQLERDTADSERRTARMAIVSSSLSTLLALATVAYGVWSFRRTTRSQFKLKLVELALAADNPFDAKGRARLSADLIGEDLPKDIEEKLEELRPEQYGRRGVSKQVFEARVELVKCLADGPEQRQNILRDWKACFPWAWDGQFLKTLEDPGETQPNPEGEGRQPASNVLG